MTSKRQVDKVSRWLLAITVVLFLLFLFAGLYGMTTMLGELKDIARGQQELILNLSQMETFREKPTAPAVQVNRELNVEILRMENETNRKLAQLQKKVDQLQQEIILLKSRR